MRTLLSVIAGFCLTSIMILAGEWAYTLISTPGLQTGTTVFSFSIALVSLLFIAISLTLGGFVSAVIDDSPEAISGFSVFQLFFGVWFFREFWTTGFIWYKPAALFLVIPCAMLGRYWAQRPRKGLPVQNHAPHRP